MKKGTIVLLPWHVLSKYELAWGCDDEELTCDVCLQLAAKGCECQACDWTICMHCYKALDWGRSPEMRRQHAASEGIA